MRKFNIKVNGTSYEVEIEEVGQASGIQEIKQSVAEAAPVKAVENKAPAAKPAPKTVGNGTQLLSPMPGTVLSLKVKNGETVKKGQTVIVLEAMKMENDIVSPCDGIVTLHISAGANIESGELIAVIG